MLTADLFLDIGKGFEPLRPKLPRHPVGMWPSEMGGCPRKTTLRLMHMKPAEKGAFEKGAMNFGKVFENYVANIWRAKYDGVIERQVPVRTPYGNGKIDLFMPGLPHLVEVKTTNWARKDFLPNPSHIDQLLLYMAYFEDYDHSQPAELTYGFSDNEDVVQSFVIPYNPARVQELITWCESVKAAVANRKAPSVPATYHPERYPCGWLGKTPGRCEYFNYCWKES